MSQLIMEKPQQCELPFNGAETAPLLKPNATELVKLAIKGWKIAHRRSTKPGTALTADSRFCLHDLIIIISKPNWSAVLSYYAELALGHDETSNPLKQTIRRAFLADGIEDAISEKVADMAVPYLS